MSGRVDHQRAVPVVGRADDDGVDVAAVEDLAEIVVHVAGGVARVLGLGVGLLDALLVAKGPPVVDVADGQDLDVVVLDEGAHVAASAPADADARDADAVARGGAGAESQGVGRGNVRGRQGGGRGSLEESSACQVGSVAHGFSLIVWFAIRPAAVGWRRRASA